MFAGSFMISLGNPAATSDPAARGALVTFRLSNHIGPADNSLLEVTAEGLIDSERATMPVRLVRLKDSTLSAIYWSRPVKGAWVLRFKIGADRYAQVPVGLDGVRPQVRPLTWSETDQTNTVLAALVTESIITAAHHSGRP
jgi:hypothetical protein